MPLDAARLRRLADELEAEEAEARRELAQAETTAEREEIKTEIEALKARAEAAERELAELKAGRPVAETEPESDDDDSGEGDESKKPKMRKGRKHGQVYQDGVGQPGYVYQGEDEPDLVPVKEDAA